MTGEPSQAKPARRLELVTGAAEELEAALAAGTRAREVDGDLRASRQSFEWAYQLAERAGDVQAMARAALGLAGLWVSERRTTAGAVLLQARLEHVLSLLDPHSSLALRIRTRLAGEADYRQGGHEAILAEDQVHSPDLSAVDNSAVAALAVAAALSGDLRTAASSLSALCGSDLARLPRSSSWLGTMNGIVETAAVLGDATVSDRAYELLHPYASLPMVGSLGITCFGSVHHALGVACLTSGHLDRAVDHLRAAVQHNLALAHWPAMVAARQRLAQAYRRRAQPGDADAARGELQTAADEAAALGMPVPDEATAPGVPVPDEGASGACGLRADCHRVGRKWRLAWRDRSVLMEDTIGMAHLAVLVANPRQEILAADLAAGLAALGAAGETGSAHPVLDQAAIAEYRNRLKHLDAELERREPGDEEDRGAIQAERDWLVAQLAGAAGFGGRVRSFPDQGERARVAVGKAIRRALARITEADPILGDHLRQTVHTGVRCSYWPG